MPKKHAHKGHGGKHKGYKVYPQHFYNNYPYPYYYPYYTTQTTNEGLRRGLHFINLAEQEYAAGEYLKAYRHAIVALTYFTDANLDANTLKKYWDFTRDIEDKLDLNIPDLQSSDILI